MAGPTYTYTAGTPQPTDRASATQPLILGNFQAISELIGANHVAFNTADDFGKHKMVSLTLQAAAPTFATGETGIYNKKYATTTKSETYINKQVDGGTVDIPFTASKMSNTAYASCSNGWSYLPSGLLMKWGTVAGSAVSTSVAINVATTSGGPNFSRVFNAFVTPLSSTDITFNAGVKSNVDNTTGNFTAYTTSVGVAGKSIKYLVIGV